MTLIRRSEFPSGMGEVISLLVYERSAPTEADPAWTAMTIEDGQEGGTCLPPTTKVDVASTARNFQLYRRAIEGPDFCAEETRSPFSIDQQLTAISGILTDYVRISWEIHDRHEYFRMCKTKVVVNSCSNPTTSTTQATTYPAACPTLKLPFGLLQKYRLLLVRDGAAESAMLRENGAPVLTCMSSPETSDYVIREDGIRTDLRNAAGGSAVSGPGALLFSAMGVTYTYRGFAFMNDLFPRRFSCSGGTYTEIAAYSTTAATKGLKAEINTSYLTADYEETTIFDPTVFTQLIPRPITSPGANFNFDPVNYTGVWKVQNIRHRVDNPDGNILYHRAIMAAASMPMYPERGVAFVHLRCDPECVSEPACNS